MRRFVVATVLSLCAAALAWWLVVVTSPALDRPDYMFTPSEALLDARHVIAIVASTLALGCVVAMCTKGHRESRLKLSVLVSIIAIGVVVGGGYGVVTAPTHGANIGGGLVVMATPPAVLLLALWAVHFHRKP